MEAPFNSVAVANWFVEKANQGGKPVTLMKLLKLVYFAHGWHLALTKKPLIKEEIEAWKFGPVAPDVYHVFKTNGAGPIKSPGEMFEGDLDSPIELTTPRITDNPGIIEFLAKIWDT